MNARKERILPPDEIEDLHDDDSNFLKSFEIKSKINFLFPDSFNILTINNKNIIKTKKKTNISVKRLRPLPGVKTLFRDSEEVYPGCL